MIFADDLFRLPFAGGDLDRASWMRKEPDALRELWRQPRSEILLVRDANLISVVPSGGLAWLQCLEFGEFQDERTIFLGCREEGRGLFAVDVGDFAEGPVPAWLKGHDVTFTSLREAALGFNSLEQSAAAVAVALVTWHGKSRYCTRCGAPTVFHNAGHSRYCPRCPREVFPRSDAAVIMLVHDDESCVLGRRVGAPANRWSTLAGFVEAGESPEAAVCREVFEEVGLNVLEVKYRGSQPWPFPASLMLAFEARAERRELHLNEEHHEVRWFRRDEVADGIDSGEFAVPSALSAGGHLILDWLRKKQ